MKTILEYLQSGHIINKQGEIALDNLHPGDIVIGIGKYTKQGDEDRLKILWKIRENDGKKLWFEWSYDFGDEEIITSQCIHIQYNWAIFRYPNNDELQIGDKIEEKIKKDKRFQDAIANKKVTKFKL